MFPGTFVFVSNADSCLYGVFLDNIVNVGYLIEFLVNAQTHV